MDQSALLLPCFCGKYLYFFVYILRLIYVEIIIVFIIMQMKEVFSKRFFSFESIRLRLLCIFVSKKILTN